MVNLDCIISIFKRNSSYICLTVRLTNQAGTKVGYSDPVILNGKGHRSTNKRYARDNRLITP